MAIYNVTSPTGEQYTVENKDDSLAQKAANDLASSFGPATSATGAAGRGALSALPFGIKGAAAVESGVGQGKYSDYLKELDQLVEADKQQHPIARGAGLVAGSAAPLLVPGVGEALGASSVAGRAAIGAGIGGLQAAGNTRSNLTSPEGLKDVALGAGTGAVLNPALGGLGDLISGGAAKAAPALEEMANSQAVQASNIAPKSLGLPKEELQALGENLRDLDLVQGSTSERTAKAQDLLKQVGAQIGNVGAGTPELKDVSPYVENLHKALQESSAIYGPDANPEATIYRQAMANLQQPGMNFDKLQELKTAYGERAFDNFGNVKNDAAANVYHQIKDAMKEVVDASPEEYKGLMGAYGSLKDITNGLQSQLQHEQASGIQSKGFGMAGKLAGMVSGGHPAVNVGLATALAPAHPFMAMGALTPLVTNPQMMSNLAGQSASALSNVGIKGLNPAITNAVTNSMTTPKIPPQYQPVFQKAIQGLTEPEEKQKQMTITDFVLQSRDPNYVKAKQDMSNENQ